MSVDFKISEKISPEIVVVDNFYENPDEIRDFALSHNFELHKEYHKGHRTEVRYLTEDIKKTFEKLLHLEVTRWESHGANGVFQFCSAQDPLVYHVDQQSHAAIVYLAPDAPPSCGTTLFKSRRTGLRASPTDEDSRKAGRDKNNLFFDIFRNNFYDKTDLEIVDIVGNVYNRLILFDAKMIHAASEYFGDAKENSRLFQIFFFDTK